VIEYLQSLGPVVWLGIGVAAGIFSLFLGTAVVGRVRQRARNMRLYGVPDPREEGILVRPLDDRGNETIDQKFDTMISQGGSGFTPTAALAFMLFLGVAAAAITYLWRQDLWSPAIALVLAVLIPWVGFLVAHVRYRAKMRDQLPDLFFLMARTVRAGFSLPQAIEFAGERGQKPLADEFRLAANQIRLGLSAPAALRLAARRVRMVDFDALVAAVTVYTTTGGNLPVLMERLASAARDHNQFRGYFMAATAQGRITALLIGLVGPALLVYYAITKPAHTQAFFNDPRGLTILLVAGILQVIGVVWIYRLLKVDY
jgi:tight adherence protein B